MRVELVTAMHANNGLTLFVIAETDVEHALLRGLWQHGKTRIVDHAPSDQKYGSGFAITWAMKEQDSGGMG